MPPVIWWVSLNVNERHARHFPLGLGAGLGLLDLGSFPSMLPCFFLPPPPPSLSDELPDHHKFWDSHIPRAEWSAVPPVQPAFNANMGEILWRERPFFLRNLSAAKWLQCSLVIYDVFQLLSIALNLYPEAGTVVIATTHDYFKAR